MRKRPDLHKEVAEALRLLVEDPFVPQLETHKLKGKLSGSWACSAGYDLRIVFDFVKSEEHKEDDIFLIAIGTHDEVY
jgi:addiction module RelE/StbE family toxin